MPPVATGLRPLGSINALIPRAEIPADEAISHASRTRAGALTRSLSREGSSHELRWIQLKAVALLITAMNLCWVVLQRSCPLVAGRTSLSDIEFRSVPLGGARSRLCCFNDSTPGSESRVQNARSYATWLSPSRRLRSWAKRFGPSCCAQAASTSPTASRITRTAEVPRAGRRDWSALEVVEALELAEQVVESLLADPQPGGQFGRPCTLRSGVLEDVEMRRAEVVEAALVQPLEHVPLHCLPGDAQERADARGSDRT